MAVIAICSSANFYEKVVAISDQLEQAGYEVLIPAAAHEMKKSGNYDAAAYKTWFGNPDDYVRKTALIREHFDEVAKADALLVVNNEKHGVANYVGGNVLMEMAVGFHLRKPIYLLNDIPEESAFIEEIIGMGSVPLHGDLSKLPVSF